MPIQLDGYPVVIADSVYDTARGVGVVVGLRDDCFEVRFGNRIVVFTSSGKASRSSHRTLFWHNPFVVTPAKHADDWDKQRQALRVFTEFVAGIGCESGEVTDG